MQSLSLPSAHRPAPAAVGGGRHGGGLLHVGRQPLTADKRDAVLGWNHCKLHPHLVHQQLHSHACMEPDTSAWPSMSLHVLPNLHHTACQHWPLPPATVMGGHWEITGSVMFKQGSICHFHPDGCASLYNPSQSQ